MVVILLMNRHKRAEDLDGRGSEMEHASPRILVVDDDHAVRGLLEDVLTETGYDVEAVGSARSMLDRVTTSPPDLVLLDVMLPDLDGVEALEQLRQRETWAHVPVIML